MLFSRFQRDAMFYSLFVNLYRIFQDLKNIDTALENIKNVHIASGGVAIYLPRNITHTEVPLNTNLEAVVVLATLPQREISNCNLYILNNY